MTIFRVEGEFYATSIDDALDFLARYFASRRAGDVPDRALSITVGPREAEDVQATRGTEAS